MSKTPRNLNRALVAAAPTALDFGLRMVETHHRTRTEIALLDAHTRAYVFTRQARREDARLIADQARYEPDAHVRAIYAQGLVDLLLGR
ncbi:MAG: hypothetical protein KC613_22150 [Myxococcales bacterium]|nr:hypothetical protein [Myxococcales bacterium]MCB9524025.1 hypothetical protein [Myxococcales bacterium]